MQINIETYQNRPTRAEISLGRIRNNFEIVRSLTGPNVKIMAMVKSNAYGHGIRTMSETLLDAGAHYLGVAYLEEAVYLRKSGITAPILVCGAINTDQVEEFLEHDIEITSSSFDKSVAISEVAVRLGKTARVHLKIDTGMERIGVHWYNAERFIERTLELPGISVKGIFSHLARAESDREFTDTQVRRFGEIAAFMARRNVLPELVHLANSAGIIGSPGSHFNMVRPGIMLYGYNPFGYDPNHLFLGRKLQPAMTLKTKVSYFKVVPAGVGISYNHSYTTKSQTRIVTLPIGYGDGYSRFLSNRGEVAMRGKRYPVVGNVCMDQVMVDIGMDGTAYNGDDVLLFGEMNGSVIPLESLCDKIGTITYEFLCNISLRVPRIYVE
ncbi:MAG TPA: alanine racemase [Spirochaetota bacterium]|nr:alanine racemase [Spirochaetota bacterium]HPC42808.1 alanine racemase [Spirochaetota bacterium]HQF08989.1 alanine racemase [Spirochaetota bacterium]HQH97877.1 alanine racemase [Spirochaetota bacterium]HQJ72568.1 alanine racemase [Spirochaetota bacterium]